MCDVGDDKMSDMLKVKLHAMKVTFTHTHTLTDTWVVHT